MDIKSKIPVFGKTKAKSNVSIRLSTNEISPKPIRNNILTSKLYKSTILDKKNAIHRIQHPMQALLQPKSFYKPTVKDGKTINNEIKSVSKEFNELESSEVI